MAAAENAKMDGYAVSSGGAPLIGAIEAGGTKIICAVGTGPDDILARIRIPTTSPDKTLSQALAFFSEYEKIYGRLDAIGIGCFGPVDVDEASPTWGEIAMTPKKGWQGANIIEPFRKSFDVPIGFDTDVNGAALAESLWGAARGLDSCVYITVGTGIGGGVIIGGKPLHGAWHPEIGHMVAAREDDDADFGGCCPYHGGACFEGLASGPAMKARWGMAAENLPGDHPAWDLEARYLAALCLNLYLAYVPQRIVLGGGVMSQTSLLPHVRINFQAKANGYLPGKHTQDGLDTLICAPDLGTMAGLYGAMALGQKALDSAAVPSSATSG